MGKFWAFAVLSCLTLAWASGAGAQGVSFTPGALRGIRAVAPRVVVTWDERITGITEAEFRAGVDESFSRGILATGVDIDMGREENLWCAVQVAVNSIGLLVYSLRVELTRTLYEVGGARRTAITWKQDMLGTVGELNLDGTDFGRLCAEPFEREWHEANPGTG